jgi:hypothetical protein
MIERFVCCARRSTGPARVPTAMWRRTQRRSERGHKCAGVLDHLACVRQYLRGDAEQFAVFRLLLGVPLLGRHPLEFQHAAASAARAIGETLYPAREVEDLARSLVNKVEVVDWWGALP